MPLTELTTVTGPGIHTQSNIHSHNINSTGIITATKFVGDGSDLTNLPAGLGTAISADATKPLNNIFYVNDTLHVTENTNAHLFKFFGRMASGTRYIGDNQMGQLMQIWEYQGNLMQ